METDIKNEIDEAHPSSSNRSGATSNSSGVLLDVLAFIWLIMICTIGAVL